ncbi:MAG: helix-turn-helix transcriptional regulator [Peptococcaceae bacterium]|nr:helix-turn-helix transcriptional regulator [Peptococcaceae bacterium]
MNEDRCCGRRADPGACEMGNLYRYTEPVVLLSLARLGAAHGYQIAQEAENLVVTRAGLDGPAIYRTLRRLEAFGRVTSAWETGGGGPARRVYELTDAGRQHLGEWIALLADVSASLDNLIAQGRKVLGPGAGDPNGGASG